MWRVENIVEHDLGTPEGLAWWNSLSEEEREKWRRRVANDGRNASGELIIGGLSPTPCDECRGDGQIEYGPTNAPDAECIEKCKACDGTGVAHSAGDRHVET